MAPRTEKSQLKRQRVSFFSFVPFIPRLRTRPSRLRCLTPQGSLPEDATESKKPRRSDRLPQPAQDKTPVVNKKHLPSPVTHVTDHSSSDRCKEPTATPPPPEADYVTPRKSDESWAQGQTLSSPPQDTQPLSQYLDRHPALSDEVEDEVKEGVWGYLVPLDPKYGDKPLVLKRRSACPLPDSIAAAADASAEEDQDKGQDAKPQTLKEEEAYEDTKIKGVASGGFLIGRHPECGELRRARPGPVETLTSFQT